MSTPARGPRGWSLQARLMATITAIVALTLVMIALAIGAILGQLLRANLDAQLTQSVARLELFQGGFFGPSRDAADVLADGFHEPGLLLVLASGGGQISGAYVSAGGAVEALDPAQMAEVLQAGGREVSVTDLGDYRVNAISTPAGVVGVGGVPLSEMQERVAQIITTVGLVTAAGLVVLAFAIAVIVRTSLRPLRAVAATATRVASLPLAEGAVSIDDRVPVGAADDRTEIGRVGAALNTLLDHVDVSLDARQRNEERMRRFIADASHELRTPLASIRGYSELSLRTLRLGGGSHDAAESTESFVERIQAQSLRMSTLVDDLLLLARLDEGRELVHGTVDLTRLVVEAVGDARPAGPEHRWSLDIDEAPILIAGDESRLHQLVANLLANARAHTPPGTSVEVSLARERDAAVLRVRDDGPGVDDAIAGELFERFARADRSRARNTGGTGLGLSIVRAIVEAHQGAISVRSVPGRTEFEVRLPADRETVPAQ